MPVFANRHDWNLPAVLRLRAAELGDRSFLSFELGGRDLTYAEVDRESDAVAAGLARLGTRKGDSVLIMLRNRAEHVLAWFGANKLGAVQVPVNVDYRGYFLEHLASISRAETMVVEADLVEAIAASVPHLECLRRLAVVGDPDRARGLGFDVLPFAELSEPAEPPVTDVRYSDLSAIHFTSGTTGPSKGAMMTHAHAHLLAERNRDLVRLEPDDVYLTHLPLFHVNAQLTAVYCALLVGARVRVQARFSASAWLDEVRSSGATVTTTLGVMMPFILKQPPRADDADNRLRCIWAVPCPPGPAEEFRRRFGVQRMVECYGNTEIGIIASQDLDEARPGSCGRVGEEWYEARLVDPETDEEVPIGEVGELVVRPKAPWLLVQGYVGMPELTLDAFRNLWFHTGDALRMDKGGYLTFVDRIKDRIRCRGENIASADVEHVLSEHPAVAGSAVVAVPSEHEGGEDEIKACLVLREPGAADAEAIWAWCDERLPRFAVPRYLEFLDELPQTPTAKARKHELRASGVGPHTHDREGPA